MRLFKSKKEQFKLLQMDRIHSIFDPVIGYIEQKEIYRFESISISQNFKEKISTYELCTNNCLILLPTDNSADFGIYTLINRSKKLLISIYNDFEWLPRYFIFDLLNDFPLNAKFEIEYEKPFFFPLGCKEFGFPDLNKPIEVIFPLTKKNLNKMMDSYN